MPTAPRTARGSPATRTRRGRLGAGQRTGPSSAERRGASDWWLHTMPLSLLLRAAPRSVRRPCPGVGCGARVEKAGGCNSVHCVCCGTSWCWLCRTVVPGDSTAHWSWANLSGCPNKHLQVRITAGLLSPSTTRASNVPLRTRRVRRRAHSVTTYFSTSYMVASLSVRGTATSGRLLELCTPYR